MNKESLILIVDDDERNIFSLSAVLRSKGYETMSALNGEISLEILRSNSSIKLVLMDVMMPVMDGLEAISIMRSDPKLIHTPVIALTARSMGGDMEKYIESGANDYCSKPIEIETLISKIENLFQKG